MVEAFRQGLRDAGYAEGRDLVFEWRTADGDYRRVPSLAKDLVQRKVDVIVADAHPLRAPQSKQLPPFRS
jgi:putative ABC transport system substrate-binding protein